MRWPFKPNDDSHRSSAGAAARSDADVVRELAEGHLTEPDLNRWLGLLRPAIQLVPHAGEEPAVARLGGLPLLPENVEWPTWDGHGPLAYIGEIVCEQIGTFPLDLELPSNGRLLFFYFDGSYDNFAATVGTWDAPTLQGARVVHVIGDAGLEKRPTPTGITTYPERIFAGRPIVTAPGWEHPDLRAAFQAQGQDDRAFMEHPVNADGFVEALHERHTGPLHQVGGYADAVQGPVEHEVALAALDNKVPYGDARLDAEAHRWELVLQVDTDTDLNMEWGDAGVLYWMGRVRESDTAEPLDEFSFTWQCG